MAVYAGYIDGLNTELASLQAAVNSLAAQGMRPDYSNGPRSVQINAAIRDARQRMREINEELARIQPGYLPMPVRGL